MSGEKELVESFTALGTVVTIHVHGAPRSEATPAIQGAVGWFHEVERRCSRFDADSELSRLTTKVGSPVQTSELLFELIRFSLSVAESSEGAFDPTVGARMAARGFNRHHATGAVVADVETPGTREDVLLDPVARTITLERPVSFDLGAVAKGLAIDLAARELKPLGNFVIDAGGDGYYGGFNPDGAEWRVGIRHPRDDKALIETCSVSNMSVCTSGDYERVSPRDGEPHVLDPASGQAAMRAISATVIAPTAMVADALATAAFVLGPDRGIDYLEGQDVEGMIVGSSLRRAETVGFRRYRRGKA
ncbi:MAG TPA: FAD:protein FMN transferase [Gemmatimonadaceae bacterium]